MDENKKKKKKIQPIMIKRNDDDELESHPLLEKAIQSSSYKLNNRVQNLMDSHKWLGNYFADNKA